jgi:Fe-S cluster assembly protein SufD
VRQSNANLLLSAFAEIDTKPELEIYADEVEASHGATVGQLDEQAVFYLRSRGLHEAEARRMLTSALRGHDAPERCGLNANQPHVGSGHATTGPGWKESSDMTAQCNQAIQARLRDKVLPALGSVRAS